jgi:peptidase M48-like protein
MTIAVYLPLLLGAALWWLAPRLTGSGSPAAVARALSALAVVAAACTTWSLALLALTLLDDVPPLKALDDDPRLLLPEPVPGPIALVAALLLLGGALRLTAELRRRVGTVRRLRRIGEPSAGIVVADLGTPMAVAVPGRPGHLLVTTTMLQALDVQERRVMFAHERAHLRHGHHALVLAAAASAALNPLLVPVREAVAYSVERWADEEAAAEVGDRDLTAKAVARAALAGAQPIAALGISGSAVVHRVRALTGDAPAPRRRRLLGFLALGAAFPALTALATAAFVTLARAWL